MEALEWFEYEVLGNTVFAWIAGIVVFLVSLFALVLLRRVLSRRFRALGDRRSVRSLQVAASTVAATKGWFLLLAAVAIGAQLLVLSSTVEPYFKDLVMIVVLLQLGVWASSALDASLRLRRDLQLQQHPEAVAAMDVLGFISRLAVWSLVVLVIVDNLGYQISALVAGLGIGGIAVALATQNILGDLFASLSIVLDKPFVVGDFLAIGEYNGSVEKVGLKTTRVRSLSGEQLIFSNADLLNSRIRNYGRMFERRVVFTIRVTYDTPPEKLEAVPGIIREAIKAQEKVRFDRAHFQSYGDHWLNFEAVYYVLSPDYNHYMDVQQNINLIILRQFAGQGIDFAYLGRAVVVRPSSD